MAWAFELKSSKIGGGRINGGGILNERVWYVHNNACFMYFI